MKGNPFPIQLQNLIRSGKITPVIGGVSAMASTDEHHDLLDTLMSLECRAAISLSSLPADRDTALARGWQIKTRTNASYDPDVKIWIPLDARTTPNDGPEPRPLG